jgi:outer membrane protein assembly factor BamB
MTWIDRLHQVGKPNARARRVPSFVLAACLAVAIQADAAWLIPRGSAQQLGVASGPLASKLSLAWKAKTGAPVTSSPVIDAERVYVGSKDGYVYAFARATGRRIWRFKTEGPVDAPPTVVGSRVVVGSSDGYLYALDAATGKLGWRYETDGKILGAANAVPAARVREPGCSSAATTTSSTA